MPWDPTTHQVVTLKESHPFGRQKGSLDDPRGLRQTLDFTHTLLGQPNVEIPMKMVDGQAGAGFIVEADVYMDLSPEAKPGDLEIHWICPRCQNTTRILSRNGKQMEYDKERNLLSVEPFECPHERGRGTDGTKKDRIAFGVGLCKLRLGVIKNKAVPG